MTDKATQALYRAWGAFAATPVAEEAPEAAGAPPEPPEAAYRAARPWLEAAFDKTHPIVERLTEPPHDPTVARVAALLAQRSAVGLAKYGVTVAASPLTRAQWLRHAQEEALDLAVYLQRLIDMEGGE